MTISEPLIIEHLQKYPKMQLQDMVKLLYQRTFGGGHLIRDEREAFLRLQAEMRATAFAPEIPASESLGNGYARIHLNHLPENASAEVLSRVFTASSRRKSATFTDFIVRLGELILLADMHIIPFSGEETREYTNRCVRENLLPVSHSDIYREAYHPAYRVIEEKYLPVLPVAFHAKALQREKKRVILAVDGNAAAGKTTFAALLAEALGADLVHADDFFLSPERRTPERLGEPGGNIDYERMKTEVIDRLGESHAFSYRIFDCGKNDFRLSKPLLGRPFTIVEGSYACHPYFGNYADCRIFLTVSPETQSRRIAMRNGEELLVRFLREWIPMENKYFSHFSVREKADFVLETD